MRTNLGSLSLFFIFGMQILFGYTFTMQVENPSPMPGEQNRLMLTFCYDNLEEYEIKEPHFEAFELTELSDNDYKKNNQTCNQIVYRFIAQHAGDFTLPVSSVDVEIIPLAYQQRYNKNKYLQKFTIHSKPITLNVQPLPDALTISGDYTLTSSIEHTEVEKGEPIIYTLTLKGEGTLKNLDFVSLKLPHTLVYEKKMQQRKIFTLLAEHSFTIPPIILRYYNLSTHKVAELKTPAYAIHIKAHPLVTKSVIYTIVGMLFGLLIYYVRGLFHNLTYIDEKTFFIQGLKACKTKETLLKKVAQYIGKDKQLARLIYQLEGESNKPFKKIKKEILQFFTISLHF